MKANKQSGEEENHTIAKNADICRKWCPRCLAIHYLKNQPDGESRVVRDLGVPIIGHLILNKTVDMMERYN